MGFFVTVGKGLIEGEVRQGQTAQRRMMVVTSVDSDRAVEDIDAVPAHSPA